MLCSRFAAVQDPGLGGMVAGPDAGSWPGLGGSNQSFSDLWLLLYHELFFPHFFFLKCLKKAGNLVANVFPLIHSEWPPLLSEAFVS